jgi:hypothetical protein
MCQERGEGGSFFGTAVASNQVASGHVSLTEIAKLTADDVLRSCDKTASLSRKKNPLHPATKFMQSSKLGGSIGFKKPYTQGLTS